MLEHSTIEVSPPAPTRSITHFVASDRRRMDDLLEEVDDLVSERAYADARDCFAEFLEDFARHLQMEERLLFPLYAGLGETQRAQIDRLSSEHAALRSLTLRISRAIVQEDARAFVDGYEELLELSQAHERFEEETVYPGLDATVRAQAASTARR
jgi:hemerythrin-like domain-containing protein